MAVLDVIENENLIDNAAAVGARLRDGLEELAKTHAMIGDIRAAGLFVGVELVCDPRTREPATDETARVVNGLRARRILISAAGPAANVLKIRPPLVFSNDNADLFLTALDEVLREVAGR
jgi:4-aminobutyrate aminotransferase-like enzyme